MFRFYISPLTQHGLNYAFVLIDGSVRGRGDLHFAADSVTSAMSTLVRELNTGRYLHSMFSDRYFLIALFIYLFFITFGVIFLSVVFMFFYTFCLSNDHLNINFVQYFSGMLNVFFRRIGWRNIKQYPETNRWVNHKIRPLIHAWFINSLNVEYSPIIVHCSGVFQKRLLITTVCFVNWFEGTPRSFINVIIVFPSINTRLSQHFARPFLNFTFFMNLLVETSSQNYEKYWL